MRSAASIAGRDGVDGERASAPTMIEEVRFAADSPLEGAGFEPSVPRERVCAFRDHVHSLQSVRHPLRSKWYVDYSDGTRPFGLDIHG